MKIYFAEKIYDYLLFNVAMILKNSPIWVYK